MQVLRTDNPLTTRGLTLGQRLGYAYSLSAWFDSWRTLGLALVPVAVLATGLFPVAADPWQFALFAGSAFVLQQTAITLLGRGFPRAAFSLLFDMVRLPSNLSATFSLLRRDSGTFAVTAKGRTGDERARARVPWVLTALGLLLLAAVVYAGLSLGGLTATEYPASGTAMVPLMWLLVTAGFVGPALAVKQAWWQQVHDRHWAGDCPTGDGQLVRVGQGRARGPRPGRLAGPPPHPRSAPPTGPTCRGGRCGPTPCPRAARAEHHTVTIGPRPPPHGAAAGVGRPGHRPAETPAVGPAPGCPHPPRAERARQVHVEVCRTGTPCRGGPSRTMLRSSRAGGPGSGRDAAGSSRAPAGRTRPVSSARSAAANRRADASAGTVPRPTGMPSTRGRSTR